jgi:NADH-quinone oxidoreductase subunit J
MAGDLLFWLLAFVAVAAALGVVVMRNPVHSALFLLLTFVVVAMLFFMNRAEFVGVVQLLVYAGGIMVLFLFTIMLVNVKRLPGEPYLHSQTGFALALGLVFFLVFGSLLAGAKLGPAADPGPLTQAGGLTGNSQVVALGLYRDYLLPFEIASVFLLVALLGAVLLGKRTIDRID